jgi:hypothetical protein
MSDADNGRHLEVEMFVSLMLSSRALDQIWKVKLRPDLAPYAARDYRLAVTRYTKAVHAWRKWLLRKNYGCSN